MTQIVEQLRSQNWAEFESQFKSVVMAKSAHEEALDLTKDFD